jgi:hypothetical protein
VEKYDDETGDEITRIYETEEIASSTDDQAVEL